MEPLEDRCLLSTAPTLAAINDVTVLAGAPLHIPLDGFDADGDALSFLATSTNSDLTTFIPQGNRSLRISVEKYGDMVFELFESRAPNTTARIVELAESGFYDRLIFHRVIKDFMIQGGDPSGTGSGGSGVEFDDEFHPDLQFTATGVLGMAKSRDDTNDSQWFVTSQPYRHLDFNHSIFGFLTEGDDVRQAIESVKTDDDHRPLEDVVMSSVSVFTDVENGVLMLAAPEGTTGKAEVTVTVSDGSGGECTRTFQATIVPDTLNNWPYLLPIDPVETTVDTPVSFQLVGYDVEGDPMVYSGVVQPQHPDLAIEVSEDTGLTTVTPSNGLVGTYEILVGVQAQGGYAWDTQVVPVTILEGQPNQAPQLAAIGDQVVDEGKRLMFTATATDADLPANTLTFSLDAGAPAGAGIDPDTGMFTWTPTEAQGPGSYQVTVRVTDDGSPPLDDFETITITVNEVNDPPVAADDSYCVDQGSLLVVDAGAGVLANDSDVEGDPLSAVLVAPPANGTLTLDADGSFAYAADAGFIGMDTFLYRANDGHSDSSVATVTISVMAILKRLDTPGLYDPAIAGFHLKHSNTGGGGADAVFRYGPRGCRGWIPLTGDFDGDGMDTVGLYDPATSAFHLKNHNRSAPADVAFRYGPAGRGWIPVVGDWDGDGVDTVGLYDPAASAFHLKNSHGGGPADVAFRYGPADGGWIPLTGDWDGDGIDTVGLYDPAGSAFHLKNSRGKGPTDVAFRFGPALPWWKPLSGDFDGDGTDTVGLYDPFGAAFHLNNHLGRGPTDIAFRYGPAAKPWHGPQNVAWCPLIGNFRGAGWWMLAAEGATAIPSAVDCSKLRSNGPAAAPLDETGLQATVAEALARWHSTGVGADLSAVDFVITDLPGAMLGLARWETIYLDRDAAGHGWFVDPTPDIDEEFAASEPLEELPAVDARAVDRMDLLTVVSHELGHVLALEDLDSSADGLMSGRLAPGLRRLPGAAEIDALLCRL